MNILVIGDIMLDRYVLTEPVKISDEAPVLVCRQQGISNILGGAGNVAANLVSLGFKDVSLVSLVGRDWAADVLNELSLKAGVKPRFLELAGRPTTIKERIESRNQQVIRVDVESTDPVNKTCLSEYLVDVVAQSSKPDIVVISDYGKGIVSDVIISTINLLLPQAKIFVNGKPKNFDAYHGAEIITFNKREFKELSDMRSNSYNPNYGLGDMVRDSSSRTILVTRGAEGIMAYTRSNELFQVSGLDVVPVDITGAGDVVLAATVYAQAHNFNIQQTLELANKAGALKVLKEHTATVTEKELLDAAGY